MLRPIVVSALFLLITVPATAQSQSSEQPLARITSPVVIDGLSDEAAWNAVPVLPLTMELPVHGGTPSQRTEIRIAYDDRFLYASGRFYDDDPAGIRINSLYRDRLSGDDVFDVLIDSFNDNETMLWFRTNPAGVRGDIALSNDAEGADHMNPNWNTYWEVEAVVNEEGWFAEMRIPLSSLGFQEEDGQTTMGIAASRYVSRLNERVTFPDIPPRFSFKKPSIAQDVTLAGVSTSKPVYVTPYALAGGNRTRGSGAEGDFKYDTELRREAGLDAKFNLTANMTLDMTANTDFAQAEADDQQINFTRFSLFYPEKRAFFQERSGLFDFALANGNRLFHSRRIGLDDSGLPVRILGGARMVGRAGEWDIGMLNMQTGATEGTSTENFGVVRLRRRVLNPYSAAGMLMTTRVGADGRRQLDYGLDSVVRLFGNDYLTLKWAQTFDRDASASVGRTGNVLATWQRRVNEGLGYKIDLGWSGEGFNPGVGFVSRTGFTYSRGVFTFNRLLENHSLLRSIQPSLVLITRHRTTDGKLESGFIGPWVEFRTRSGGYGWVEPRFYFEDVLNGFAISDKAAIPADYYRYRDIQIYYDMPVGQLLRATFDLQVGTFYDGRRGHLSLSPTWNISRHLEIGGKYQLTRLVFADRNQQLTAHLAQLRSGIALNARLSVISFLQFNSVASRFSVNSRMRYNFREGKDLWIVLDDTFDTDGTPVGPQYQRSLNRSLLIKYTHTFII